MKTFTITIEDYCEDLVRVVLSHAARDASQHAENLPLRSQDATTRRYEWFHVASALMAATKKPALTSSGIPQLEEQHD